MNFLKSKYGIWFKRIARIFELTNRQWFSEVCTFIDNENCRHSGQNVVIDWIL